MSRNMCKSIFVIVLKLIVYDLISCEIPIECNQENISRCWTFIESSAPLQLVVPSLDKSKLEVFCRNFDYFDECFTPVREKCFNYIKFETLVAYEGYGNAFSYLCKETRDEYLTYQPCFGGQNLQLNAAKCNESLIDQLKRVKDQNDTGITIKDKTCQAGDLYVGCVDNNVKVLCRGEAASWMMNYNKKILSPLLRTFQCKGWNPDPTRPQDNNATTISLVVCFSLIFVVTIFFVLNLICLKTQLFKSLPAINRINASRIKKESSSSCPPPYVNDPSAMQIPKHKGEPQISPSDEGSNSSGYFSTFDRTPDESAQYFQDASTSCTSGIDRRAGSVEAISFRTSGKPEGVCRTLRSQSAEYTQELPRVLQPNMSLSTMPHSSTITPPHFEPPVANPFTSPGLQKDDPIITDYYC